MSLLKETKCVLSDHGKSIDDVIWVGCASFEIPMAEFVKLADVNYDSGYGAPEVAQDLVLVGEGWWIERREYDGSEWWEYCEIMNRPPETRSVTALTVGQYNKEHDEHACGWRSLAEINGGAQ